MDLLIRMSQKSFNDKRIDLIDKQLKDFNFNLDSSTVIALKNVKIQTELQNKLLQNQINTYLN